MNVEIVPEPDGVGLRPRLPVAPQRGETDPPPGADFVRVGRDRPVIGAGERVHDLVLDIAVIERGAVMGLEQRRQPAGEAHLF